MEEIKFEKAMERLEKIVEDLEAGNVSLEDALKKYEEGVKLSRLCQKRLAAAEKKIEILTRAMDGTLEKEPFDFETAEEKAESPSAGKSRKQAKPENGEDEETLF